MTLCSAVDCKKTGIHIFPKDIKRRKQWIKALRRKNWQPSKYSRLCADHFKPDDYHMRNSYTGDENIRKVLKKNRSAIHIFIYFSKNNKPIGTTTVRKAQRSRKKIYFETANDQLPGPSGIQKDIKCEPRFRDEQLPVQMEVDIHPQIELLGNDQPSASAESKFTQVNFEHIYGFD